MYGGCSVSGCSRRSCKGMYGGCSRPGWCWCCSWLQIFAKVDKTTGQRWTKRRARQHITSTTPARARARLLSVAAVPLEIQRNHFCFGRSEAELTYLKISKLAFRLGWARFGRKTHNEHPKRLFLAKRRGNCKCFGFLCKNKPYFG